MNDLLFIRHAETDMAGTFCGQSDPPVNAAGHRQIRELIEGLRNEPIAAVYTSDLQRAVTTARTLAASFAVPCSIRPALREIYFGGWESLTWAEAEKIDPAYAGRWVNEFPKLSAPGGEAVEVFEARVLAETSQLISRSDCCASDAERGLVAVVTHAGVMRVILRTLCGVDEQETWRRTKSYCCTFIYCHTEKDVRSRIFHEDAAAHDGGCERIRSTYSTSGERP